MQKIRKIETNNHFPSRITWQDDLKTLSIVFIIDKARDLKKSAGSTADRKEGVEMKKCLGLLVGMLT